MNKTRVLITGASGFIGSPLVKKLLDNNFEVLAISRNKPEDNYSNRDVWYEADINKLDSYKTCIEEFQPQVVIHLAWQDIPNYSFEISLLNLKNTLEFLSFVSDIASCKKILISGSCWEFNKRQGECIESLIGEPKDHFTWAKHSIRTWLEIVCKQKQITLAWIRIFYVYGPRQRRGSLIPTLINHLSQKELPPIKTPNDACDFIYIDDVVDGFYQATNKNIHSGNFNLGSGFSIKVLEVSRHIENLLYGKEVITQKIKEQSTGIESSMNFWAGINKTKETLNWKPMITIEDGIKNCISYDE
ncbi:MAG: NAD(P)-dependent oxidoreductase [Gammaproteobacteria bacterium]|nr:NAD(P)-dependent oxidoreductase [Gammaproteobacteria bacterium]